MTTHRRSVLALTLLVPALLAWKPTSTHAVSFDGEPKILLHLQGTTTKNQCALGSLSDCGAAVSAGRSDGSYYFAYLLTAKGNMPDVGGAQVGITYQDGSIGAIDDGQGIDIFEWRLCASLQFTPDNLRAWPRPQSGNLITWGAGPACQAGDTGVLGYFYLGCYGTPDALILIPRPVDGLAKLANCASVERVLAPSDLGSAVFTPSGSESGCNPCLGPCTPPAPYPDSTPPAASTIALTSKTFNSVRLEWIVQADDPMDVLRANRYDLRYSLSPITEANFDQATRDLTIGTPGSPGNLQRHTVIGLDQATTYYFALKTGDEVPNWSGISNVLAVTTNLAPGGDPFPPAAVTDLATLGATPTSLTLQWTATGDDGITGTATEYDIRRSTSPITAANFPSRQALTDEPTPLAPGASQTMVVSSLISSTTYYFAMQVVDEVGNHSPISNVAVGTTTAIPVDLTPPAAVVDLAPLGATTTSVLLGWTAPGDDSLSGAAAGYDLRYSTAPITPANANLATPVSGEPVPASAGTPQQHTVTFLTPLTTYYFCLFATDDAGNRSGLSNVPSAITISPEPDSLPPAPITDLAAAGAGPTTVALEWTAPGDDGMVGLASAYDLRFSTVPITLQNFGSAQAAAVDFPSPPGTRQQMTVGSLSSRTLYYFAIRTRDDVGQWSELSNVASRQTASSNGRPNLMLHVKGVASKNACSAGQLSNCQDAVTRGDVAPVGGSGPFYFVYLTATDASTVGGLQCGISYDGDEAGGAGDRDRIDIFDWVLCATLQFASSSPRPWPAPGSGNLITWDVVHACQTNATPVAGYFYIAAYGSDTLRLIPRPADGLALVSDCSAQVSFIPLDGLGTARFSPGAAIEGVNPCGRVPAVPVEHVTWSRIKSLTR